MADDRAPRLCVLIDADNVPARYAEAIFDEISGLGEASVRRIYGDWSSSYLKPWSAKIAKLGMVADQQFANTKGKNASDIGLVISAMDFLHSNLFDGFVLVSSDSDFTMLAARIREQGLDVFGIGEKKTPEAFRMACKRFIYVENVMPEIPEDKAPETKEASNEVAKKEPPSKAVPLILKALKSLDSDNDGFVLSRVKAQLVAMNSDFDERTYGCEKIGELMDATGQFIVDRSVHPTLVKRAIHSKKAPRPK